MTIKITYKYKRKCILCHKTYGSDFPNDNKICSQCRYKMRYREDERRSEKYYKSFKSD